MDPNLINSLGEYINALKIEFDPEENIDLFKSKIIDEFNDVENFSCNMEYLKKVYLDPIREIQSIKDLAKKLLYLYTTHYKNIFIYHTSSQFKFSEIIIHVIYNKSIL